MADTVSARRTAAPRRAAPAAATIPDAPAPASTKGMIMNDTIKQLGDKVQSDGKAAFEQDRVAFGDVAEFSRGNVEALVEATRIAGKGLETMAQQSAAYAKASFDKGAAAAKSLTAIRSPTEFASLHGEYVRGAFDDFVAEASRSTEAALKLAGEVARPLQNRVALAAEKAKAAA